MPLSARWRLLIALLAGLFSAALGTVLEKLELGVLIGIAVTATVFVMVGWLTLWRLDAEQTQANLLREELPPVVGEIVVVAFALSGLGAVVALLVEGGRDAGALAAAIALVGVFMAWAALHLMYAVRYADRHYDSSEGGIDFNTDNLTPTSRPFETSSTSATTSG